MNFLNDDVLGLADYEECLEGSEVKKMHTRLMITATVTAYDEKNYWVMLGSPKVSNKVHDKADKFNL